MNVADYMRHRLVRAGVEASKVDSVPFGDLCALANDEFGEETLTNWGVWHWVAPHVRAAT